MEYGLFSSARPALSRIFFRLAAFRRRMVSEWPMSAAPRDTVATARRRLEAALGGLVQMLTRLRAEHRNALLQRITPHLETARQAAERLAALEEAGGPGERRDP